MLERSEDLYDLLEVSPTASQGVIRAAYYVLARVWHPDVNSTPEAAQRIRDINDAYRVLSDPLQRAGYDLQRARARRRERLLANQPVAPIAARRAERAPAGPSRASSIQRFPARSAGDDYPIEASGRLPVYGAPAMLVLLTLGVLVAVLLVLFSVGLAMGDDMPQEKSSGPNVVLVTK